MRRRVAALLLTTSVVVGVGAGVVTTAVTPPREGPEVDIAASVAVKPLVEIVEPFLVINTDGSATLSATLISHHTGPLVINEATNGLQGDGEAPRMILHGTGSDAILRPGVPVRIGGLGDGYRLRTHDRVQAGSTLPIALSVSSRQGLFTDGPVVTAVAPVVARTSAHADVADNGPNTDISVHGATIVLVPGQDKAYIGGWIESTIDDVTELRPVGRLPGGRPIDVLHQTATGGPSGFYAQASQRMPLGGPPYVDDGEGGDADYVRSSEVRAGQTVTITIRFPSGDVVGRFRVVKAHADGTI
jgi:hypothetical protein